MNDYLLIPFYGHLRSLTIALLTLVFLLPSPARAQGDGPRFYWKGLDGTNAFPVIFNSMGGNANPQDASNTVLPGSNFNAIMASPGYARFFHVKKRAAMGSILVPMGRISGDATIGGLDFSETARGFGDPMVQLGINVVGPKAIMNIPDMIRYKPRFSMDIFGSLAIPIGEYDNKSPINIGQNRWYGRIGLPIVAQLSKWVPGKRTTLEILPAVWFYSDNKDFVGKTIETKPKFQFESHITRDFMARFWGSLDLIWYTGGKSTIDGVEGEKLNNLGIGGTLGYQINDNLQLTAAYVASVNDKEPTDLNMDMFRFTLICGWHQLIEGMNRLKENE